RVLGMYSALSLRSADGGFGTSDPVAELPLILEELAAPVPPPSGRPEAAEGAPNIIFIVSESFFDISRLPNVSFSRDPIPVFHSLQDRCVHGRFISNTYGGGTGYVEMEIMTGVTGALLREGDTLSSLPPDCYDAMPSIVKLLDGAGYSAAAIHSHNDKLYNRRTIYPRIGYDRVLFSDDFPEDAEKRGPYISDAAFADEIISLYETDGSGARFIYGMSMENHQPYNAEKYGFSSGIDISSPLLRSEDLPALDALLVGLADADASLGKLIEYFSEREERVMLVFVGDHLPTLSLPSGDSVYSRLGLCSGADSSLWEGDELLEMLSTDYLIWTNYPSGGAEERRESCTFLGLDVMQRAGVPLNGYFKWLDTFVRPDMLMYRSRLFADGNGVTWHDVPEDSKPMLDAYRRVVRAVIYGEVPPSPEGE
ncbi:MAG: LTA synthase family protein, partial [Oscillospiraceae bacterium]|nr:LTA synthase family protein [Oscillospiraceae bacterium]